MDMQEIWLTVEEVRQLTGQGETTVRLHIRTGKCVSRQVKADGAPGGKKYEIRLSSLPETAQKQYQKNQITQEITTESGKSGEIAANKILLALQMTKEQEQANRLKGMKEAMGLTGKAAARDAAKHTIISAFKDWHRAQLQAGVKPKRQGQYGTAQLYQFCVAYNAGQIPVDEATQAVKPTIDQTSLWRWMDKLKQGEHLGGAYGKKKGCGKIDRNEDMKKAIVGLLAHTPHVSSKQIYNFVAAKFGGQAPSQRHVERWVANWKVTHAGLFLAHSNPDAWKNEQMVAYGSLTADVERINQRWALDSSPADLMLEDGRHQLLLSIDLFSRYPKFLVAKTSKAVAVASLLRRCILDWGKPDEIKTDNGQDYASLYVRRVCNFLDIEQNFSQPFSPWEKGTVERMFRTFAHGLFELLPGFIGHNVAEQQEIRARKAFSERLFKKDAVVEVKMTAEALQVFCDRWVRDIYLHEHHAGLGTTPFLKAQECRATASRIDDERVLDMLLAEAPGRDGVYTLQKKGLKIEKGWYFGPEMALYPVKTEMRVLRLDNAGEVAVYAYDRPDDPLQAHAALPGLHFVCVARCPERAGMSREEHRLDAVKGKHGQTQQIQGGRKQLKQIIKESDATEAVAVIFEAAEAKHDNVHAFPKQSVQHGGAGIDAAREAVKALDAVKAQAMPSLEIEVAEKLAAIKQAPKSLKTDFESTFERCMYLMEILVNGRGGEFSGEDWEVLRSFPKTADPRSVKRMNSYCEAAFSSKRDAYLSARREAGWPVPMGIKLNVGT